MRLDARQMRLLDCKFHAAAQSEPLRGCTGMVLTEVGGTTVHTPADMHAAIQATGQRHVDNSIVIDLHFSRQRRIDLDAQTNPVDSPEGRLSLFLHKLELLDCTEALARGGVTDLADCASRGVEGLMALGLKLPHARRITAACMKLAPPSCCDEAEADSEQALADVVDKQRQERQHAIDKQQQYSLH